MDKEVKLCECCGKRPVGAGKQKYCDDCAKHSSYIRKVQKQGKDISQLSFSGNKLCECCGKRPVNGYRYCEVCQGHKNLLYKARKKGIDLSTLNIGEVKLCQCCGKKPIGKHKQKYCDDCGKHIATIYDNRKKGRDASQLRFLGKLCECCHKRPVNGYKYCEVCQEHLRVINTYQSQGKDISQLFFLGNKLCACCGKPVEMPRRKYCNTCHEHSNYISIAKKRGRDLSKLYFVGNKLCACCDKRPIGKGRSKYCDVCGLYISHISASKKENKDISQLSFTGNRICERCGVNPVSIHSQKYCNECKSQIHKNYYRLKIEQDLNLVESGKVLSICPKCGIRPRKIGGPYCKECHQELAIISRRKKEMEIRGIDVWTPLHIKNRTTCKKCNTLLEVGDSVYCKKCRKEYNQIYNIAHKSPALIKPVADPTVYFNIGSSNLTCPICQAEFCLPNLPLGIKCRDKIISYSRYTSWQTLLTFKGIKVPTLDEIVPPGKYNRKYCTRCRMYPVMPGYLFCEECMLLNIEERAFISRNLIV